MSRFPTPHVGIRHRSFSNNCTSPCIKPTKLNSSTPPKNKLKEDLQETVLALMRLPYLPEVSGLPTTGPRDAGPKPPSPRLRSSGDQIHEELQPHRSGRVRPSSALPEFVV